MHRAITRPATDLFSSHYVDRHGRDAAHQIEERMREVGLVTLDGLDSRDAVLDFAHRFLSVIAHRDSEPDGLTVIHDTGSRSDRPGFAGLGSGPLQAHTERSSLVTPPRLMLLVCLRPAEEGGVCLLTDGRAVHVDLATSQEEALHALSEERAAFFGNGDGVFAPVFQQGPGDRVAIRLRQDGLVRWHPLARPHVPRLRALIEQHQRPLELAAGEGYLLDNHRWLHARTAFRGPRRYHRALGDPRFLMSFGFSTQQRAAPLALVETRS